MSVDSSYEVQKVVRAVLLADATLTGYLANASYVFDDWVPRADGVPYLTLEIGTGVPYDTKGSEYGMELTLTVHTWTEEKGTATVKTIMSRIHYLLHDADLPLVDHTFVNCRFSYQTVVRDPDAESRHGLQRFRVVTTD